MLEPTLGYDTGITVAHLLDITPFAVSLVLLVSACVIGLRGKKVEEFDESLSELNRCDGCGETFRNFTNLTKVEGKGFLCGSCLTGSSGNQQS
jgi:hypothetical protein